MDERRGGGMTRREALGLGAGAAGAALLAPMINRNRYRLFAQSAQEYSARTVRLMEESTVLDMLAPWGRDRGRWMADPDSFTEQDFRAYDESGIDVFHIATGVGGVDPFTNVLTFVGRWNGFVASHPDWFMRITTPEHLREVGPSGKVGILVGVQNSEHFRTVDDVEFFHGLGQRVSQLTYNSQNRIGTGCMESDDGGLSDFGADVVARMNEVGMAVDLGHCGDQTTLDGIEASARPPLITHSNVRALVPGYPRNKTDEAIRRMAAKGGVMGMTAVRSFVRGEEPTNVDHLVEHYDYVARLVGVEHVGIGTDHTFEGNDTLSPEQKARLGGRYHDQYRFREKIDIDEMRHPKRTYDLTEGLVRRGYSDADIELILGGNFIRVLSEIWSV